MPRPTRIEYENAFYHVMNRGKARQTIFHNKTYYLAFLDTLEEVSSRFSAVIHAYCLMSNHYHLVVYSLVTHLSKALYALQYMYGMVLHIVSLVCQKCNSPLRVKQGGV